MKITPHYLEGLFHVEVDPHIDTRGLFARVFCEMEFADAGLATRWVQMNVSFNSIAGTVRGLHFQTAKAAEAKVVRCIRGLAHDIALDLRRNSESFGRHAVIELDSDRRNALYIPSGFAHGFQTLVDGTELQYLHSGFYDPKNEGGVNALDPTIAVDWPLPISEMSDRDASLPPLEEVQPL